jgi:hypothetical protein
MLDNERITAAILFLFYRACADEPGELRKLYEPCGQLEKTSLTVTIV